MQWPQRYGSVTITVSFLWGVIVFGNPVKNWFGAIGAIVMLLLGVVVAAVSSRISDQHKQASAPIQEDSRELRLVEGNVGSNGSPERADKPGGKALFGAVCACGLGLCNGTLMVAPTCFQNGCSAIGIAEYTGNQLAPLAFLPSLAVGVLVAQPVLFLMYWGPSMAKGVMPEFHFSEVAIYGLLTGAFWAMGNFSAMFATVYLGQTIGFPLTQCCLILNGVWGIAYYKEIVGQQAITIFIIASAIIIVGATLDGMFG